MTNKAEAQKIPVRERLGDLWCEWTHGGGSIKRDADNRINWQCGRCGRWSRHPVSADEEKSIFGWL